MPDPADHPLYDHILKMVLWGEDREKIYRVLETNKVIPRTADELYNHARAERIRTIRKDCTVKMAIGLAAIIGSITLFCTTWYGMGFTTDLIIVGCTLSFAFGVWKATDGLTGILFASSKEGSIADD